MTPENQDPSSSNNQAHSSASASAQPAASSQVSSHQLVKPVRPTGPTQLCSQLPAATGAKSATKPQAHPAGLTLFPVCTDLDDPCSIAWSQGSSRTEQRYLALKTLSLKAQFELFAALSSGLALWRCAQLVKCSPRTVALYAEHCNEVMAHGLFSQGVTVSASAQAHSPQAFWELMIPHNLSISPRFSAQGVSYILAEALLLEQPAAPYGTTSARLSALGTTAASSPALVSGALTPVGATSEADSSQKFKQEFKKDVALKAHQVTGLTSATAGLISTKLAAERPLGCWHANMPVTHTAFEPSAESWLAALSGQVTYLPDIMAQSTKVVTSASAKVRAMPDHRPFFADTCIPYFLGSKLISIRMNYENQNSVRIRLNLLGIEAICIREILRLKYVCIRQDSGMENSGIRPTPANPHSDAISGLEAKAQLALWWPQPDGIVLLLSPEALGAVGSGQDWARERMLGLMLTAGEGTRARAEVGADLGAYLAAGSGAYLAAGLGAGAEFGAEIGSGLGAGHGPVLPWLPALTGAQSTGPQLELTPRVRLGVLQEAGATASSGGLGCTNCGGVSVRAHGLGLFSGVLGALEPATCGVPSSALGASIPENSGVLGGKNLIVTGFQARAAAPALIITNCLSQYLLNKKIPTALRSPQVVSTGGAALLRPALRPALRLALPSAMPPVHPPASPVDAPKLSAPTRAPEEGRALGTKLHAPSACPAGPSLSASVSASLEPSPALAAAAAGQLSVLQQLLWGYWQRFQRPIQRKLRGLYEDGVQGLLVVPKDFKRQASLAAYHEHWGAHQGKHRGGPQDGLCGTPRDEPLAAPGDVAPTDFRAEARDGRCVGAQLALCGAVSSAVSGAGCSAPCSTAQAFARLSPAQQHGVVWELLLARWYEGAGRYFGANLKARMAQVQGLQRLNAKQLAALTAQLTTAAPVAAPSEPHAPCAAPHTLGAEPQAHGAELQAHGAGLQAGAERLGASTDCSQPCLRPLSGALEGEPLEGEVLEGEALDLAAVTKAVPQSKATPQSKVGAAPLGAEPGISSAVSSGRAAAAPASARAVWERGPSEASPSAPEHEAAQAQTAVSPPVKSGTYRGFLAHYHKRPLLSEVRWEQSHSKLDSALKQFMQDPSCRRYLRARKADQKSLPNVSRERSA